MKKFVQVLSSAFLATIALSFVGIAPASAATDPVIGYWKTIDDKDKKPKSIVKIWEKGGVYYGKIVKLFRKKNPCPKCDKCKGKRKNTPTCGITMIWGLKKTVSSKYTEYKGGEILDPKNGKIYRASLWVTKGKPNILKVRGHFFIFHRTQTWHKAKAPTKGSCVQKCGPKGLKKAAAKPAKRAKAAAKPAARR